MFSNPPLGGPRGEIQGGDPDRTDVRRQDRLRARAGGAAPARRRDRGGRCQERGGLRAAAREADALYAKGRRITKKIIDGLERCRVISLGSVGVDSVDVAAATARGVPVTNVPDTFIEEVDDHAMTLLLATFRRLTTMGRMVREGRWREGRPLLYRFPRLMGQTLGLV